VTIGNASGRQQLRWGLQQHTTSRTCERAPATRFGAWTDLFDAVDGVQSVTQLPSRYHVPVAHTHRRRRRTTSRRTGGGGRWNAQSFACRTLVCVPPRGLEIKNERTQGWTRLAMDVSPRIGLYSTAGVKVYGALAVKLRDASFRIAQEPYH
jgi:hypothetical protein